MTEEQTGAVEPEALAPDSGDVAAPTTPENGDAAATAAPVPPKAKAPEGPPRLRLDQLKPGEQITGTVKNIAQFGAFIDIGAEQDGLVHISELSENRVRRVEDVVKPGQQVEVTILDVDTKRKRISLSMKPRYDVYEAQASADDDDSDPAQTTMQAAFQRAQEKKAEADEKQRKSAAKKRAEQDDILSRTLNNLRKNP